MAAETVLNKAVTWSLGTHIDRSQETVMEWLALHPILEVCDRDTGYEGGGRRRNLWWRQTAARKQLRATLKYISLAARERRWKSGRSGKSGGGERGAGGVEYGAGRDGSWYAGTEIGDAQVGE